MELRPGLPGLWRRRREDALRTLHGKLDFHTHLKACPRRLSRIRRHFRPQGEGTNDRTLPERVLNLVTSLPFLCVGYHQLRHRQSPEGRLYGASIVGAGLSALAFHATRGSWREACRQLDYASIAASSGQALRALYPSPRGRERALARAAQAAGLLAAPFRPTLVTALHTAALELEYLRQARRSPQLHAARRTHAVVGAIGFAVFSLEDIAIARGVDVLHSAWHLLAAFTVHSYGPLFAHQEARRLRPTEPL